MVGPGLGEGEGSEHFLGTELSSGAMESSRTDGGLSEPHTTELRT